MSGINVPEKPALDASSMLICGKIMVVIPELENSVILLKTWLTERICPERDNSPMIPVV